MPYLAAYHGFQPEPDDNPQAIPCYRAAAGIRAVVGEDLCRRAHSLFHAAFCHAGDGTPEEGPARAAAVFEDFVAKAKPPTEPRKPSFYLYHPEPQDPREIFKSEYRRAFPGKRTNSREANELWKKKEKLCRDHVDKVYQIQKEKYDAALTEHQRTVTQITERHVAAVQAHFALMEEVAEAARKLREDKG